MPGAGRSDSTALRVLGAVVALIAVVGYVFFDWSFSAPDDATPVAIGVVIAVLAVGVTAYDRLS